MASHRHRQYCNPTGAVLVMAGILSSLVAFRFGAFAARVPSARRAGGEIRPGGIKFDDVRTAYLAGPVALALILFDGGLRTRFASIRAVLAPSVTLATVGVVLTGAITAPVAKYALNIG